MTGEVMPQITVRNAQYAAVAVNTCCFRALVKIE